MVKSLKTKLKGVLLLETDSFEDHRGRYVEIYNEKLYRATGVTAKFLADDYSYSTKNVLRGIHADPAIWKLISCLHGKFYLVIVNCDRTSKDFGIWQSFMLSAANHRQIFVPPKYGVAHLILSDEAIFHYKQSGYYDPLRQMSFKWDDPAFNIWWPVKTPILSQRDEVGHYVRD